MCAERGIKPTTLFARPFTVVWRNSGRRRCLWSFYDSDRFRQISSVCRQCCNIRAAAHERHDAGVVSDCDLEQPSDEMEMADNLTEAHPPGLPLPNCMHGFVTLDRAVGSPRTSG